MKPNNIFMSLITGLALIAITHTANAEQWYPIPVFEWHPPFNTDSKRSETSYSPTIGRAEKKWRICASIPHLKDAYWLTVNYALVKQAEAFGVSMSIFEAGGYSNHNVQVKQIENCLDKGMDALIVSVTSVDGANDVLAKVHAAGIPIIDLINVTSFPNIAARSAGDYYDNAYATAQYLVERHKTTPGEVTVLWFPGPKVSTWAQRGNLGFLDGIKGSNITLLATKYGDPDNRTQGNLVKQALDEYPDVDYIAGGAVTADAATSIIRKRRIKDRTQVIAYYFGPGAYRSVKRGSIIAVTSDLQAIQSRIAVDQAIRILENKPFKKHVGSIVKVIDKSNLPDFDLTTSLAPPGYKAIFDVN